MKCCSHCESADDLFNADLARRDLREYREKGPAKQTQLIIDTLKAAGVDGLTLLDIGGGIGAIQHELLAAGAGSALGVDASRAYLNATREEAQRRGYADRIEGRHGDFVAIAGEIPPADIVTLDRVVCCYPDMPALVSASSQRAQRYYALVFPLDRWYVKIGVFVMNLFQRIRREPFRVFAHPTAAVDAVARENGLTLDLHQRGLIWQVLIYTRENVQTP